MKTIGLIGGTSWVSTADYYKIINQEVNRRLGGHDFARCVLFSVNLADILRLGAKDEWDEIANMLVRISNSLIEAGADSIMFCANTLHFTADKVKANIGVPFIHIAEETAKEIVKAGYSRVGLLGTKLTMEKDFYKNTLSNSNIDVIIPDEEAREYIQYSISEELCKDIFNDSTKNRLLDIMNDLKNKGAEGIILGCTEIPLLIKQEDTSIPLFDTLEIHAMAAVDYALENF